MSLESAATTARARPAPARPWWRWGVAVAPARPWVRDALLAVAAMALALGLAIVILQVWRGPLSVPFEYSSDDANYQTMLVKGIIDHGSWFTNPSLGAPFGQQLYDFSIGGDTLDLLLIRGLALFSSDAGVVTNLYYLLTFPLAALTALLVLRWWGLSAGAALVASVLFALTPYHFLRGEHHAFLAASYSVPLGCYLALGIVTGRPLFARRTRAGPAVLRWASPRTVLTVVSCLAVASTGTVYYPAFTLILVVAAGLLAFAARRERRTVGATAVVVAIVCAGVVAVQAPTLVYVAAHGRDAIVAHRLPTDTAVGGFTFGQLVLPIDHHRLAPFASAKSFYDATATPSAPNESFDDSLGLLASAGFVWLLWVAVSGGVVALRRRAPAGVPSGGTPSETPNGGGRAGGALGGLQGPAALTVVAFLFGTLGGVPVLISYFITPQLRGWNRLSIFIAFLALLALGALLDRAGGRLRRIGRPRLAIAAPGALLAAALAVGVLDQTSPAFAPAYRSLDARWANDARFVQAIERRLPHGAMVFQLPYQQFPEAAGVGAVKDYDPLMGYLHSRALRWSYGAMKGRPADLWQTPLAARPPEQFLAGLVAAGFDGLYLDGAGYPSQRRPLEARLERLLDVRPLVSADRRLSFFDLRPYAARLRRSYTAAQLRLLRTATLRPPILAAGGGVSPYWDQSPDGHVSWWLSDRRGTLELVNQTARPERVRFSATLITRPGQRALVRLRFPGVGPETVVVGSAGRQVERTLTLRPGRNPLELATSAAPIAAPNDPRTLRLQILDPSFEQEAFAPFYAPCAPAAPPLLGPGGPIDSLPPPGVAAPACPAGAARAPAHASSSLT